MFLLLTVPNALFCECEMNGCARERRKGMPKPNRSFRPTFLGDSYAHPPPPGWRSLTSASTWSQSSKSRRGANICTP